MNFLHSMVRVSNLELSMKFYCEHLGLIETHRYDVDEGRFTLIFLAASGDLDDLDMKELRPGERRPLLELTYNWDSEEYNAGRNFGHLAYHVDDIYEKCQSLIDYGVEINRPPRDGKMAFIRSPDGISIELLQKGSPLTPQDPWKSMKNIGHW